MRVWLVALCLVSLGSLRADGVSIHKMLSGDHTLELKDTIQLTTHQDGDVGTAWISPDGRYVAYSATSFGKDKAMACLRVVRSSGGRSDALLSGTVGLVDGSPTRTADVWVPMVDPGFRAVWSPDSRLIAFPASHIPADMGDGVSVGERHIMVKTPAGLSRGQFALPRGMYPALPFVWSPDGRRLAVAVMGARVGQESPGEFVAELLILDLSRQSVETVFSRERCRIQPDGWSTDGKAFRYYVSKKGIGWECRQSSCDGRPDVLLHEVKSIPNRSPNGRLQIAEKPGVCVEDLATGSTVEILKGMDPQTAVWTPDSKMIAYRKRYEIKDETGQRSRDMYGVWLAVVESNKMNHMCVALDVDKDSPISFSADGMKMSYVSHGRAFTAELEAAPVDLDGKIAAGLPLTEEEEKQCLMANARQIGTALHMYASDWDGRYPSGDDFMDALKPYLKSSNLFFRPGTEDVAFQYFPLGNWSDVKNMAETAVGIFDVGYGWQVIVYADGHVKTVPKL